MLTTERQLFIEKWPLFAKCDCENFYPPDNISRKCPICAKETTWSAAGRGELWGVVEISGYYAHYRCVLCQKSNLAVFVRIAKRGGPTPATILQVQKIWEDPPPSIYIPSGLQKRLFCDVRFYKKPLLC